MLERMSIDNVPFETLVERSSSRFAVVRAFAVFQVAIVQHNAPDASEGQSV